MLLDVAAFGVLLGFTLLGAWRGWRETGLRLLSLALAYGAAVYAAANSGPDLADSLGLSPLWGPPIAGLAAFLAAAVLLGIVAIAVRSADRRRLGGAPRSAADRTFGAVFGVARGFVLVLLLGWLGLFAQALRAGDVGLGVPDTTGSAVAALSGRVVERGARSLLGDRDPGARLATRLVARPRDAVEGFRAVMDHPGLAELQRDAFFWGHVEQGALEAALARPSFTRLADDAVLRRDLARLGVIEASTASPAAFRDEMKGVLAEIAPKLRALREDPQVEELLMDAEVRRMLETGDTLGLLGHAGFQDLVRRLMAS